MLPVVMQTWNKFQLLPKENKRNYLIGFGVSFLVLWLFISMSFIISVVVAGVGTAVTAYWRLEHA